MARHRPAVLTEVSPALLERISGVSAGAYLARLLDLGYELALVDRDGDGELLPCGRDPATVLEALAASGSVDVLARPAAA
jgi:hypothetical protein